MGKQWFYADGERSVGPVTDRQLRDLMRRGIVTRDTLVTVAGSKKWYRAAEIQFTGHPSSGTAKPPALPASITVAPPMPQSAVNHPAMPAPTVIATIPQPVAQAPIMYTMAPAAPPEHRPWPWFKAVGTSVAALAIVGVAGWIIFELRRPSSGGPVAPGGSDASQFDGNTLQRDVEQLQQEKFRLEQELKDLGARRESLRKWTGITFAMVNPTHFAVGIEQNDDGRFQVVSKSQDDEAVSAIRVAGKAGVPRIANDRTLTRKVYQATNVGDFIETDLDREIRKFWRPHRFTPFGPEEQATFVAFHDLSLNRRRIGFFGGEDNQNLKFQGISKFVETIRKELIAPGTAWRGNSEAMQAALSDIDQLDFAVMNIAQRVGTEDHVAGHVDIALAVKLDARTELIEESKTVPVDRPDLKQIAWNIIDRMIPAAHPGEARRDAVRSLRDAQFLLENEMYVRLTKMGLPVVERENLELVIEERERSGTRGQFDDRKYSPLVCASHMVVVELVGPRPGGHYVLSIRLIDVNTGRVLFAMQGTPAGGGAAAAAVDPQAPTRDIATRPRQQPQFLLHSGRLALVDLSPNVAALKFPNGAPTVGMSLSTWRGMPKTFSRLVHLEDDATSDQRQLRTLFGQTMESVPKNTIAKVSLDPTLSDLGPTHPELLPAVLWRLSRHILPPGGYVVARSDGKTVVTIGRESGIQPGTRFRIVRPSARSPTARDEPFATEYAVASLSPRECEIVPVTEMPAGGSDSLLGGRPATGDVAVAFATEAMGVATCPLMQIRPDRNVRLDLSNKRTGDAEWGQKTRAATRRIEDKLAEGFRNLGLPVVSPPTQTNGGKAQRNSTAAMWSLSTNLNAPPNSDPRVSHQILGFVKAISDNSFHVELNISLARTGATLEQVGFDVAGDVLR